MPVIQFATCYLSIHFIFHIVNSFQAREHFTVILNIQYEYCLYLFWQGIFYIFFFVSFFYYFASYMLECDIQFDLIVLLFSIFPYIFSGIKFYCNCISCCHINQYLNGRLVTFCSIYLQIVFTGTYEYIHILVYWIYTNKTKFEIKFSFFNFWLRIKD